MTILVAEDNAVTATLMAGILTRHGYTVILARNGFEALSLLGTHPDIQGVITDLMMPESSGLDLLCAMRENPAWRHLPVIMTTVRDDPQTVAHAVALGSDGYILKPVRPALLIERVMKVFGQERAIMMSTSAVTNRYSLSLETYKKLAKNFATQVDQAIAALQIWSINNANVLQVDFLQIMESATLLGAERLIAALEETFPSVGSPPLTPHQCARLLEELQLVQKALRGQVG
ncbi:MAG: response regulator [Terriglobia bacterium]|jgi:CheY-like chemotaxis protein